MKYKLFGQTFRDQAGGDGGDGGGGGNPDVAKQIADAVAAAVAGLKSKNEELLGKLKNTNEQLKAFEGIDPVATKELLARFENDEELKLIKDGKHSELIERKTEKARQEAARLIKAAEDKAAQAEARASQFSKRVLDNQIREAAAKVGIHAHAIEDALFRGHSMFTLDADGQAVQLDQDGQPVLGKDGKSVFRPLEWLEGMKEVAPHWFPAGSSGGGAPGGSGSAKGVDLSKMAPVDRLAYLRNNPQK